MIFVHQRLFHIFIPPQFKDMETNITQKAIYISREEKNGITQAFLKDNFDYRDGFLYYKKRASHRNQIGDFVGSIITDKYKSRWYATIKAKNYYNHRLIFCWHKGFFPEFVDHIDHDTLNNRIENLREATRLQNNCNVRSKKGSSSEYLGVYFDKRRNRYCAQIGLNGKSTHIASCKTENEAALAYNREAVRHFKEFANPNIIKPKQSDI